MKSTASPITDFEGNIIVVSSFSFIALIVLGITILVIFVLLILYLQVKKSNEKRFDEPVQSPFNPNNEKASAPAVPTSTDHPLFVKKNPTEELPHTKAGFSLPTPEAVENVPIQKTVEDSLDPIPPIGHKSTLLFLMGARKGDKIRLDNFPEGTCAIGRSNIPENNIVIPDDTRVGRQGHAVITRDIQGKFAIHSDHPNGVYINNNRIEQKSVLMDKDIVKIGDTELQYLQERL